jgi:hypothetical protein
MALGNWVCYSLFGVQYLEIIGEEVFVDFLLDQFQKFLLIRDFLGEEVLVDFLLDQFQHAFNFF